jgi:transposase
MIMPEINTEVMNISLREFARSVGAGTNKQILLMWDGAGWHKSQKVEAPEGIHLMEMLAYTPELQPAERLWPLLNEGVANEQIDDLDCLEQKLVKRCKEILAQPETVTGLTNFHWWPNC